MIKGLEHYIICNNLKGMVVFNSDYDCSLIGIVQVFVKYVSVNYGINAFNIIMRLQNAVSINPYYSVRTNTMNPLDYLKYCQSFIITIETKYQYSYYILQC